MTKIETMKPGEKQVLVRRDYEKDPSRLLRPVLSSPEGHGLEILTHDWKLEIPVDASAVFANLTRELSAWQHAAFLQPLFDGWRWHLQFDSLNTRTVIDKVAHEAVLHGFYLKLAPGADVPRTHKFQVGELFEDAPFFYRVPSVQLRVTTVHDHLCIAELLGRTQAGAVVVEALKSWVRNHYEDIPRAGPDRLAVTADRDVLWTVESIITHIPFDVMDANTHANLIGPGIHDLSHIRTEPTRGSVVYRLSHDQLGPLGVIRIRKLSDAHPTRRSALDIGDAPIPTTNEMKAAWEQHAVATGSHWPTGAFTVVRYRWRKAISTKDSDDAIERYRAEALTTLTRELWERRKTEFGTALRAFYTRLEYADIGWTRRDSMIALGIDSSSDSARNDSPSTKAESPVPEDLRPRRQSTVAMSTDGALGYWVRLLGVGNTDGLVNLFRLAALDRDLVIERPERIDTGELRFHVAIVITPGQPAFTLATGFVTESEIGDLVLVLEAPLGKSDFDRIVPLLYDVIHEYGLTLADGQQRAFADLDAYIRKRAETMIVPSDSTPYQNDSGTRVPNAPKLIPMPSDDTIRGYLVDHFETDLEVLLADTWQFMSPESGRERVSFAILGARNDPLAEQALKVVSWFRQKGLTTSLVVTLRAKPISKRFPI